MKIEAEPRVVDSAFLPSGEQVCIWSDGVAMIVDPDTGERIIGVRKAKNLIAKAREATQ